MTEISTPLGPMLAGATLEGVCLLEFTDRIRLEKEFDDLKRMLNADMVPGRNQHTDQLEKELGEYFEGKRKAFSVPLHTPGNEFSQSVWKTLRDIPYGKTWSYKEQSEAMNNPKAIRAIAATNGRNRLAIVIPCHRVIGSDGSMTGYAAGVDKKKWLLNFERNNSATPAGHLF
jgi:O-6-methylguanine DNA methyltransferase